MNEKEGLDLEALTCSDHIRIVTTSVKGQTPKRLETRMYVSISPLPLTGIEAAPFAEEPVFDQGEG